MTILNITGMILLGLYAWEDLRKKEIWILPAVVLGSVRLCLRLIENDSVAEGIAGLGIGLLFVLISWFTHQAIGFGDSCVIAVFGILSGPVILIDTLLLSFLGVCIFSLFLLGLKKGDRKTSLPFLPFLFTAALLILKLMSG